MLDGRDHGSDDDPPSKLPAAFLISPAISGMVSRAIVRSVPKCTLVSSGVRKWPGSVSS